MRILLALSGGIDSMYLAENASSLIEGASFAAAHCNFHLRGSESDGDEAFVRSWCESAGMPLYVKHFQTREYASQKGLSIEMAARELRYVWFDALCREEGFDGVAVAHNANDNAETLVLNLLRGSGTRGLRGMSARSVIPVPGSDHVLLRPMLGISRAEIVEWMTSRGKQWREDSSNASSDHTRNRVRHELFPLFIEINPSFLETLGRDMDFIAQVDDIAEDYYRDAVAQVVKDGAVDIASLLALKHWRYVLWRIVSPFALSADMLAKLEDALGKGQTAGGKRFGPLTTTADRILLPGEPLRVEVGIERAAFSGEMPLKRDDGSLIMDAAAFREAPVIRPWRAGDWMVPFGMKGRKKLSDLFTDLRFTPAMKAAAKVVEHPDGEGRIAALAGWRIDDSVRVTDRTKEVIILKIK